MKRYQFRLEKVMKVRRIQQDQARAGVVEARRRADEAVVESARRLDAYATCPAPSTAVPAAAFLAARALHELKAQALVIARDGEEAAWEVVSLRLDEWSDAARRVSALERLDARRREEYALELRRDEDAQVDDLVVSRARAGRSA